MVGLQGGGAMAGLKTQGIGPLADSPQGLSFLETGLAQIRQGLCSVSAATILQERSA
jgi:hypothetical protein